MKKYFVVSDIHSFYTPLKNSLRLAGYQKKNKDHILIVCGDVFDRGEETLEVYRFLTSIPKKRCILVKGNHESLFMELLKKSAPDDYDFSNGTVKTFCAIAGVDEDVLSSSYYFKNGIGDKYRDRIRLAWRNIVAEVEGSKIYTWLNSDQWKDYHELDEFIFVHSFIPLKASDGLPYYYVNNRRFEYFKDWRTEATDQDWEAARWGCPWKQYKDGYFAEEIKNGKKLVVGHWRCSDFWSRFGGDYDNDDIFYDGHIVAIDGGVKNVYVNGPYTKPVMVHHQNVFVIDEEDDTLKDQYGYCLVPIESPYTIETVTLDK